VTQAAISRRQVLDIYRRREPVSPPATKSSWSSGRRYLLTAGMGAGYHGAVRRLVRQARGCGWFSDVFSVTDNEDRPAVREYLAATADLRSANCPGFGYWSWKPFFVLRALERIEEGAHLYYLDAGCELSPLGTARMQVLDGILADHGGLFFELPFLERDWTKPSLLARYRDVRGDTRQIQATWFGIRNSSTTRELLREWWNACSQDDFRALRDEPGARHRHDQSVLSCLVKQRREAVSVTQWEDVFVPWLYVRDSWVLLEPVHALRQRGAGSLLDPLSARSDATACERNLARASAGFKARVSAKHAYHGVRDAMSVLGYRLTHR
jgi:hypothetical protein